VDARSPQPAVGCDRRAYDGLAPAVDERHAAAHDSPHGPGLDVDERARLPPQPRGQARADEHDLPPRLPQAAHTVGLLVELRVDELRARLPTPALSVQASRWRDLAAHQPLRVD
jgi:hypothetical protein